MKNIVGQTPKGDDFFKRDQSINQEMKAAYQDK